MRLVLLRVEKLESLSLDVCLVCLLGVLVVEVTTEVGLAGLKGRTGNGLGGYVEGSAGS